MPFYPTAQKDDGYDIVDFFGVDPRLGNLGDFVELVRTARAAGIRVIVDFVMNHTSDAHPWFKSARRSVDDPYRDYYVWSATEPKSDPKDVVFPPDQEDSIWELDPKTNQWYLHHFYKHQPDLNIANPKVQEEISRTLGFWLELGVSGFRIDAVPFLFARDSVPGEPGSFDPFEYLGDVRNFVTRRVGDAVLLGEVNVATRTRRSSSVAPPTATDSTCSSTSSECRTSTSHSPAATRARWPRRCVSAPPSTSPASGPTSCAITTS